MSFSHTSFSWQRFVQVFRHQLISQRKELLRTLLAYFLGFFALMGLARIFISSPFVQYAQLVIIFAAFATVLYMHLDISRVFSMLKVKQGRINHLMLPATNLEKFVARLLISSLVLWVCYPLLFVLADVGSFVVSAAVAEHNGLVVTYLWSSISSFLRDVFGNGVPFVLAGITLYFSSLSNYLFGASIFRTKPFILTSLSLFILSNLGSILLSLLLMWCGEELFRGWVEMMRTQQFSPTTLAWGITLFNLLWIACLTWFSYRRFVRVQVIPTSKIFL